MPEPSPSFPAWIRTIPDGEEAGPLGEVYATIRRRSGRVAPVLECQSLHPEGLRDHYALYRTLMYGLGGISRAYREAIAVAVSAANGCRYCLEGHSGVLLALTGNADLVAAVEDRAGRLTLPADLREALEYAEKLTLRPSEVTQLDVQRLRDSGFDDRAILQIAEIAAYFSFVNRLVLGLGVCHDGGVDDGCGTGHAAVDT